jgi:ATP synthase I chain
MTAVAAAGALIALFSRHGRWAAGFAIGAMVAILAYAWLHQGVAAALNLGHSRVPKRMVLKLAIRYPLALGILFLFYRTGWLPFEAIVAGLLVPAAGAFIECLYQAGQALFGSAADGAAAAPEDCGQPSAPFQR